MNTRSIVLLVVLAGFVGLLVVSMGSSLSQYTDFATAKTDGGDVHVVAEWVERESAHYDAQVDRFSFYLQDSLGTRVPCVYPDPKPVNFETADRVVVQGRFTGEVFEVSKIQLKCPSKYEETELGTPAQYTPAADSTTSYPG